MAVEIEVYIVDRDGSIKVKHSFYGETYAEAHEYLEHHKASCSYFKTNYDEGNVVEFVDEEVDVPDADDLREEAEEDNDDE